VRRLAAVLDRAYRDRSVTLCGVLTGGVVFAVDLARAMANEKIELSFIKAASYGSGTTSSGRVELEILDEGAIVGRDVLVVEDIFESGRTLKAVVNALRVCGAKSVKSVVLLEKPGKAVVDERPDWLGFTMEEDVFVAGYGLDGGQRLRGLADIVVAPVAKPRRRRRARA
jgi:hypoxanthine phosphoribosyltransferase